MHGLKSAANYGTRVFFVCPNCRGPVFNYECCLTDGETIWRFTLFCPKCRKEFRNDYHIGKPPDMSEILKPANLAKLVEATREELLKNERERRG